MSMNNIMICPCCMEKHEVRIIHRKEKTLFKELPVEYDAQLSYCELTDETFEDEVQLSSNDIAIETK